MIVLDTHIWIWWVDNNLKLTQRQRELINTYQSSGLGISIISCWEVAKLVENQKLILSCSVDEWLNGGLAYPGVQLLSLTLPIIVASTELTGFHRDPADQLIVATAQIYNCSLLTADNKILAYPHVQTLI
ncbi:type II toxin-antitoxin system VapC family toxin [Cronbergia sp. UHCC 0137]|uniref:type II toxin-antitoxin system VapC family toxin n=1 Tax=Cronbergia sp. UHCC 0137 TaxID=3110239 RepID=UPI002B21574C|nr:type II toxin-antitoxin system VapC family toxin [Cronbergia sp. UHCC 0137]MEA5619185.1 type II toxin-antitoxin system VapC family toxin [Cronbergia sp. UHCC 0137]